MTKVYIRDNKGKFSRKNVVFYAFMVALVLAISYLSQHPQIAYVDRVETKIVKVDNAQEIITKEKEDILNVLSGCESQNDVNAINWEDYGVGKNRASFGAYMLKIGTIQKFVKGLSDFQAIALASDSNQSRALSSYIIFETKDGIYNWRRCMERNGLLDRVNFVKTLESKITK